MSASVKRWYDLPERQFPVLNKFKVKSGMKARNWNSFRRKNCAYAFERAETEKMLTKTNFNKFANKYTDTFRVILSNEILKVIWWNIHILKRLPPLYGPNGPAFIPLQTCNLYAWKCSKPPEELPPLTGAAPPLFLRHGRRWRWTKGLWRGKDPSKCVELNGGPPVGWQYIHTGSTWDFRN